MTEYPVPDGYAILDERSLPATLAGLDGIAERLGGIPDSWTVTEISDGNMNAVFRVSGPRGSVVAKQALPHIRSIGPDWPFPVGRAVFEARAARIHGQAAPDRVVPIHASVEELGLIVMEDLREHTVLRHALTKGRTFPCLAKHLGAYLADSLIATSDFALSTGEKDALKGQFSGNHVLCETTQDVVFSGPYWDAPLNHTTPGQEGLANTFRADVALGAVVAQMKYRFRSRAEALVHGDLHTGSIMVTAKDTRVIDAEWAFMGPMGFDIGTLLGNLLLSHAAQPGLGSDRKDHAAWILDLFEDVWRVFADRARDLIRAGSGSLLIPELAGGAAERFIEAWLAELWPDVLGYAGCEMIRRIIGISHVEDFEWIKDVGVRAACEARALHLARRLLLERHMFATPQSVAAAARVSPA